MDTPPTATTSSEPPSISDDLSKSSGVVIIVESKSKGKPTSKSQGKSTAKSKPKEKPSLFKNKCDWCDLSFNFKKDLKVHQKTHWMCNGNKHKPQHQLNAKSKMVACDYCFLWVCQGCSGLSSEAFDSEETTFTCDACVKKVLKCKWCDYETNVKKDFR